MASSTSSNSGTRITIPIHGTNAKAVVSNSHNKEKEKVDMGIIVVDPKVITINRTGEMKTGVEAKVKKATTHFAVQTRETMDEEMEKVNKHTSPDPGIMSSPPRDLTIIRDVWIPLGERGPKNIVIPKNMIVGA